MKRIIPLTLICLMLISTPFAFASGIDLNSISDDDLVFLHNQLEAEIAARGIDVTSLIYEGVYVVGKDIKAGQYILTVADSEYGMDIIIFESEDTYNSYFSTKRFTVGEENAAIEANAHSKVYAREFETVNLNLHDGMVLLLKDGIGRMESITSNWAP